MVCRTYTPFSFNVSSFLPWLSFTSCQTAYLLGTATYRCASGCVVECHICKREVAGSNLGRGYFKVTKVYSAFHPSGVCKWVPAMAGRAKVSMAHSDCGWTCGCAGKTVRSLRTRAIPERFCSGDSLRRGAISSVCTFTFTFPSIAPVNCVWYCIDIHQ